MSDAPPDAEGPPAHIVRPALHEIRNAIFGVTSLLQLLAEEDAIAADDELSQLCSRALQESSRVGALVSDLAAVVRPAVVARASVRCDALMRSVLDNDLDELAIAEDGRRLAPTLALQGAAAGDDAWVVQSDARLLRRALAGLVRLAWRTVRTHTEAPALAVRVEADPQTVRVVVRMAAAAREPLASAWTVAPPIDSPDGRGLIVAALQRRLDALGAALAVCRGGAGVEAWRVTVPRG